jgi:hypothetical protein
MLRKRHTRKRLTPDQWAQIYTAYASGIGLREIARNMDIPAGTVLAHAKREGWTRAIESAKALVPAQSPPAVTPADAAAATLGEHSKRTRAGLARAYTRAAEHASELDGRDILERAARLKDITQGAGIIHGWNGNGGSTIIQVGVALGALADLTDIDGCSPAGQSNAIGQAALPAQPGSCIV